MTAQYERARIRVEADPELDAYHEHLLDDDWGEGSRHYAWVADAPRAEVLTWCASVAADEAAAERAAGEGVAGEDAEWGMPSPLRAAKSAAVAPPPPPSPCERE